MKKLFFSVMTVGMLSLFGSTNIQAANSKNPEPIVAERKLESKEVQAMIDRIEEIKAMDFSSLSLEQKKALKSEMKAMKHDLKYVTGVYISVGALIIILILLLLLL